MLGMPPSRQAEQALLDVDITALRAVLAQVPQDAGLDLFESVLTPALESIGRGWEAGELALAQVYMASRLVERLIEEDLSSQAPLRPSHPRVAMAVLEDYHLLGKRLVLASTRLAGWAVADWGVATDPVELARRAHQEQLSILMVSTLMERSARRVAQVVETLRDLGATTRVVVGGAPFRLDPSLCTQVGAAGTAATASAVPALLAGLLGVAR